MSDPEKIATLLNEFCEAAISKGDQGETTEKDHELYETMKSKVMALRELGTSAMDGFKVLLSHKSEHVQVWVASELLADGDLEAKATLEHLASKPGLTGFSASIVLDEFNAGKLKSPFGTK